VKVTLAGVAQSSGFTVTLNTNQDTAPGGTVTFASAPASGVAVKLRREIPIEQRLVYRDGDRFPAKATERGLDHAVMLAQQVDRRVAEAEAKQEVDRTTLQSNISQRRQRGWQRMPRRGRIEPPSAESSRRPTPPIGCTQLDWRLRSAARKTPVRAEARERRSGRGCAHRRQQHGATDGRRGVADAG
jgi:hypothetical protein